MGRFVFDLDDETHQEFKATCALEGKSMTSVMKHLISLWIDKHFVLEDI